LGIGIARGQYYWVLDIGCIVWYRSNPINNASDYRANGLLSDYIGWTNGLTDNRTIELTD